MFERWQIPDDICNISPIGKDDLDLFVGHRKEVEFISSLLNSKTIVFLEGEIGVGKTSMGNFIRFSKKKHLSPIFEVPCKPYWSDTDFLLYVTSAIVKEIVRDGSDFGYLKGNKYIKELNKIFSDTSDWNLGITVFGSGFQLGKTTARTKEINLALIIDRLIKLGQIIQKNTKLKAPIVIQINNIDINHTFSTVDVNRLFNDIRDTLQIPFISWLICGYEGVSTFIEKNVPRVGQIIGHTVYLNPLILNEIEEAFKLRIRKAKMKGSLPVTYDLLSEMYTMCIGSFRKLLNNLQKLLSNYYNDPLITNIGIKEAQHFFKNLHEPEINNLMRSKIKYSIFKMILNNPGINQKNIAQELKKSQPNISRGLKELESKSYINSRKTGQSNSYYPDVKYYFGFANME